MNEGREERLGIVRIGPVVLGPFFVVIGFIVQVATKLMALSANSLVLEDIQLNAL